MRKRLRFVGVLLLLVLIKDARGELSALSQPSCKKRACNKGLGMGNGHIKDSQITASSYWGNMMKPENARLKPGMGGWCANVGVDKFPHLQIDLLTPHTVTKLVLEGAYSSHIQQYWLSFSYDTKRWFNYTVDGNVTVFRGSSLYKKRAVGYLPNPLTARALRIHAIIVDKNSGVCGKLELYGCQPSENCSSPVGMEDRRIPDHQITASSHWNQHYAKNARLHNQATTDTSGVEVWGGWCTDRFDKNQFLQVDLGRVRTVAGVATQGYMWDQFVSQYKVNYSTDGQTWQSYRDRTGYSKIYKLSHTALRTKARGVKAKHDLLHMALQIFQGNWDNDTVIKKMFARRILARYIRFNPIAWNNNGYICMRVEVFECLPTKGSVPSVNPPSETVELNRTASVNLTCLVSGQPGLKMVWLKNRISSPPQSDIYRSSYVNGSIKSVLTLRHVKYKDRGAIFSCTAWYSSLSINSTRNVHLLVHAPRPVMAIPVVKARSVTLRVTDPTPGDTAKYRLRYKSTKQHMPWSLVEQVKTTLDSVTTMRLKGLLPYMTYLVEVAPYYKDDDIGPYSLPKRFTTQQAAPSGAPRDIVIIPHGKDTMRVSWSSPSHEQCNGIITKYEVMYKVRGNTEKYLKTDRLYQDITDLNNGRQYQVAVRAYTKVGPGPFSEYQTYFTAQPNQGSEITASLEKLNRVTVTDTNAVKLMAEVRNITSKSSKLVEKDIAITANILNKVVKTNSTSADIGDQVLGTISHVMDAKGEILKKTQLKYNTTARFVQILEDYIDKGGKFSKGTPNIAVHTEMFPKIDQDIVTSVQTTKDQITFNTTANLTNRESEASLIVPSSVLPANDSRNSTLIVVYYRTSRLFAPDFRKTEVCEDGFTKDDVEKVEPPLASSYTMENSSGDLITESSPVLAASLKNKQLNNLTTPIIIKFKMPREKIVRNNTRCVWWDFSRGAWSTSGCSLRDIVNDTIICECNHMTNFAALVDVDGHSSKVCGKHSLALSLISYVGCALSIVGLALTIFTYGFFKKLRKDVAAKILLQLCASLLCVLIVFVSGVERGSMSEDACRIIAVLIHYFLLVAFLWMLIEAYFMYLAFVKVWRDQGDYIMWKCAAVGWGLPILVVITTLAVDHNSYGGKHYCRLGDIAFFAAFMAPVLFVIVVNTVTFLIIMYKLSTRPANSADRDRGREGLLRMKRAFGILILVGITWVFGFMAVSRARLVFQYLFAIFNCLQGFAIFMFYCVIQKNVRECWWALVRCDLRSLQKSKLLYTDSYDRRRLSSASRAQNDAMRARANTALSQILQLPMRDVTQEDNKMTRDFHYHNNVADEESKAAQRVKIMYQSSDYQVCDSQNIDSESGDEFSSGLSCRPGSRSPSLRSHVIPVAHAQSRNSSIRGSQHTVNSVQSTPKMLRLPRIKGLHSAGTLNRSRDNMPVKEVLKRTASHTPEVPRPLSPCICLRRTKSASSLVDEKRFSGDVSLCSDQTSCESLSSEAQTPTRKQVCLPVEGLGVQIVSPFRGSVRGIVGYVETAVENFDLLINLERKRSLSPSPRTIDGISS